MAIFYRCIPRSRRAMKAAVLEDFGRMVVRDVPDPSPGEGEVTVRVKACGICQTDNLGFRGQRRDLELPTVLGHEIAGVVDEVGEGVGSHIPGDEVVVIPVVSCGRCNACRMGYPHQCEEGIVIGGEGQPTVMPGGFAEKVLVPESVLYRKPEGVSFEAAALTEPLGCAYKGLVEYSHLTLGEDVVVIGSGTMGLLLALVAISAGAARVAVVDRVRERLALARKIGVHHTVDTSEGNPISAVREVMPEGPDVVMEAGGTLEAARLAMALARKRTRVNMFGVIVPGEIPVSPKEIHFTEIRIDASFSITPRAMLRSLRLMEMGLVNPEVTITHRFPLAGISEAFQAMDEPERVTVMVLP